MAIELGDDGTMDTVVYCDVCGQEWRGNFDPDPDEEDGEDAYDAFVDEFIAEVEDEHGDCANPTEPDEDALTTSDHRTFYQYGKVAFNLIESAHGGRLLFDDTDDPDQTFATVEDAIRAYMDREQFWPDAWFISDHGNAHRIDLAGAERTSTV